MKETIGFKSVKRRNEFRILSKCLFLTYSRCLESRSKGFVKEKSRGRNKKYKTYKAKYTKYKRKLDMEKNFWQEGVNVLHNLQIEKLVLFK